MKEIEIGLEGAEMEETRRLVTIAGDSQAAIKAVERMGKTARATSEEGSG